MTARKTLKSSIKGKSGSSTGQAQSQTKAQQTQVDVQVTVLAPSRMKGVHPAQHFDTQKKIMYYGFQLPVEIDKGDGKPTRKIVNCLVSDKGETIACIESELQANDITLQAKPLIDPKHGNRISDIVLEEWQRTGGRKPVPWPLPDYLEFVVKTFKEVIDFTNEDYFYYLALWNFGTYCHRIFESFAYGFYNGPTSTGKTKTLEALEQAAFNAVLSPSMSPSSLFRAVESRCLTLLMDETEKLWKTEDAAEIRPLVLSGYKRGAAVMRTEKVGDAGFSVDTFSTYSPKAFANISGLDDVLENRCIKMLMARSKDKNVLSARLMTSSRRDKWQDIRNQSYLLVYRYWLRIAEINENHSDREVVEGVLGRPLELWNSIFILSELFEENGCVGLTDRMTKLAVKQVEEMTQNFMDSSSGQVIRALKHLMMSHESYPFCADYYPFSALFPIIAEQATFAEEGVTEADGEQKKTKKIKKPQWLTPPYMTRQLRLLGLDSFKGNGSGRSVLLTKEGLIDLWERYMGEWEEPVCSGAQTRLDDPFGQSPIQDTVELTEAMVIDGLKAMGKGTWVGWRDTVVKVTGCTFEQFEEMSKTVRENPCVKESGNTPKFFEWSEE